MEKIIYNNTVIYAEKAIIIYKDKNNNISYSSNASDKESAFMMYPVIDTIMDRLDINNTK